MTTGIAVGLPAPAAVERAFERDLAWLARRMRAEVRAAVPVSPLRGRGRPFAAFRVELADGRVVKLRRMNEPERAAGLEGLLGALAPIDFPRVLARRGRLLVLEWIPGTAFTEQHETTERIRDAAELLARIHCSAPPGHAAPAERTAAAELARSEEQLAVLVASAHIAQHEADALAHTIRARIPERQLHGITHGDFAPENFVIDESGALRVIDNESIRVTVLDLDVARVWSRWPMDPRDWQAFLSAYASAAGRACSDDDLVGWKVRTLLLSAWYRTSFDLGGAKEAVARLREFGATLR